MQPTPALVAYVKVTTSSDYAVFLAFQGYDSNKVIDGSVAKIKVFTEDGEEVDYELAGDANSTAYKKTSGTSITVNNRQLTAGDILKLTKNSSDKVTELKVVAPVKDAVSPYNVNAKGVFSYDNNLIKSSTVVFEYDKYANMDDADNWSVAKYSSLFGSDSLTLYGELDTTKGEYKVVSVNGGQSDQDSYVIFTAFSKSGDDVKVKVLEDGSITEYICNDTSITNGKAWGATAKVTSSAMLYKLKLNASGEITSATKFSDEVLSAPVSKTISYEPVIYVTTASSFNLNNGILKVNSKNYAVDDDMLVYVFDLSSKKWTTEDASYLDGLDDDTTKSVQLFDTLDDKTNIYNYAIVMNF